MELRTQVTADQFDGKDVIWFSDTHAIDQIIKTFKLPVLVKVVEGYMINETECLETGSILSVHGVRSMEKIIALDHQHTELSIPVSCAAKARLSTKDECTFKTVGEVCNATPLPQYLKNTREFTHQKQTYAVNSIFAVRSISKWSRGLNVTYIGPKEQRLTLPLSLVGLFKELSSPAGDFKTYFMKDLVNKTFPICVEFQPAENVNNFYRTFAGKIELKKLVTANIVYGTSYEDGKKKLLTFSRDLSVRLQIGRVIIEDANIGEYSTIAEPVEEPIDGDVLDYILHLNPYYGNYNIADYVTLREAMTVSKHGKTVVSDPEPKGNNKEPEFEKEAADPLSRLDNEMPKLPPRSPRDKQSGLGSITNKHPAIENTYHVIGSSSPPLIPKRSPREPIEGCRETRAKGVQDGANIYSDIADDAKAENTKPAVPPRASIGSNSSVATDWKEKALAFCLPLNTAAEFCYEDLDATSMHKCRPKLPPPGEKQTDTCNVQGVDDYVYPAFEEITTRLPRGESVSDNLKRDSDNFKEDSDNLKRGSDNLKRQPRSRPSSSTSGRSECVDNDMNRTGGRAQEYTQLNGQTESDKRTSKNFDVVCREIASENVDGICRILEKLQLHEFKNAFIDIQIDGELLGDLSEDDLVSDIGMSLFQARKLYVYIRGWQLDEENVSQGDDENAAESWTVRNVFERMKSLNLSSFAEFCSEHQVNGVLLTSILENKVLESIRKDHGVSMGRIEEKKLNSYVLKRWRPKP